MKRFLVLLVGVALLVGLLAGVASAGDGGPFPRLSSATTSR